MANCNTDKHNNGVNKRNNNNDTNKKNNDNTIIRLGR